jgi:hypothetical protein
MSRTRWEKKWDKYQKAGKGSRDTVTVPIRKRPGLEWDIVEKLFLTKKYDGWVDFSLAAFERMLMDTEDVQVLVGLPQEHQKLLVQISELLKRRPDAASVFRPMVDMFLKSRINEA